MSGYPSITAADLSNRIKAFQSALTQGTNESREEYVSRVQQQLAAIEGQLPKDQELADATLVKGWVFDSYHLGGANGPKVSSSSVEAAKKELLPADKMFGATLRGVVERETSSNRQLGRTVKQWQHDVDAAKARANAAMKDLVAGKSGAAASLSAALNDIRDTLRKAGAEASADDAAIESMRSDIEGFAPVTRDTGLFSKRTAEENAYNQALALNNALKAEPAAERSLAQSGSDTVRQYVVAQLEHDPAFANRNYPGVTAQIAAWDQVGASSRTASTKAHEFAGAVSDYRGALSTVADGPSVLAQLDGELGAARVNYDQAVRDLRSGQAQYAQTARQLAVARATAEAAAATAALAARNAGNAASDWKDTMEAKAAEASRLASRISDLESEIRDLGSSTGNAVPGGGSGGNTRPGGGNVRPGGGNPTPGGGGGNLRPGGGNPTPGGSVDNSARVAQARRDLEDARDSHQRAVAQYNNARAEYADATNAYDRAAYASNAAATAVAGIISQQRDNEAFLAGLQQREGNAKGVYSDAQKRRARAQEEIETAKRTIAAAPQTIPAKATAYNNAVAALETVTAKAGVGDDGHKALQAAPVPTLPVNSLHEPISARENGSALLNQAATSVVQATNARNSVVSSSRQRLQNQADQIVNTAINEALK